MTKRGPKGRRSSKDIERHIEEWRASGLTISEFAKKNDLPRSNLYQWISARREKAEKQERPSSKETVFVEVVGTTPLSIPLTLESANGLTMKVDAGSLEPETLRVLIEAMRGC